MVPPSQVRSNLSLTLTSQNLAKTRTVQSLKSHIGSKWQTLDHQGSYRLGMTSRGASFPNLLSSQEQVLTGPVLFSTDLKSLQTMLVSAGCFSTPMYTRALAGEKDRTKCQGGGSLPGGNNNTQRLWAP